MLFLYYASLWDLYTNVLRASISVATFLSLLVSLDRIHLVLRYMQVRLVQLFTGKRPIDKFNYRPLPDLDNTDGYPRVAVQLPMFNERAVCQTVIDSACELNWPTKRFRVQVLDDSTDKTTRELVDDKVAEWRERGLNIECIRRTNRQGYKAGAMKEGMEKLSDCDYVAIFDADFRPDPDFLRRCIPYLESNPDVGFVQARWAFANPEESYLTKAQEISLNYHMKCEQFIHFSHGSFFNFNGTAGVWRKKAVDSVGGWYSRTTVEDMDLSLRAFIYGWKAVFLEDVAVVSELPASFFAYRKQQHRWTCGPVQLWRKASNDIWNSNLSLWKKLDLTICYFGIRKFATHWVSLGFFCTLVPLSVFNPEVSIPLWALVHLPVAVTISTALFTPKGFVHSILYVLFENAMGVVKIGAVLAGLFDLKGASEWVVTTKLGQFDKSKNGSAMLIPVRSCKLYAGELVMSIFVFSSAMYGVATMTRWSLCLYLTLQGLVFLAFALNLVDCGGLLGGRIDGGILLDKNGYDLKQLKL